MRGSTHIGRGVRLWPGALNAVSLSVTAWGAVAVATVVGLTSGCGSPEHHDEVMNGTPASERFGLVLLTHESDRSDERVGDRMTARGWFFEGIGLDGRDVVDFLGVPTAARADQPRLGTCDFQERSASNGLPATRMEGRALYFMDAGELSVAAGTTFIGMRSGYFPDVHPDVGGLVYEAQEWPGRRIMRQNDFVVRGAGSPEVGAFDVEVTPPYAMRLHEVAGERVRSGRAVVRDTRNGLPVAWHAGPFDGSVVIEVTRRAFDRDASVRCVVSDAGLFTVPREALDHLPDYTGQGDDSTDVLEVSRATSAEFDTDGIDAGAVVVVARDSVILEGL